MLEACGVFRGLPWQRCFWGSSGVLGQVQYLWYLGSRVVPFALFLVIGSLVK